MKARSKAQVIIGNWKMNKTIAEAKAFVAGLEPVAAKCSAVVGLAVPFTALSAVAAEAHRSKILVGAQNVSEADNGALTGEISSRMIKDAGAAFALVGHSERRRDFHEQDVQVNLKVKRLLAVGLRPVLCIGETLAQRESGAAHEVLAKQLHAGLNGVTAEQVAGMIIAYEPVWAIGTSKAATPADVQEAHAFIRSEIVAGWGKEAADGVVLQYGGSVAPHNAAGLLSQPDVDGLLVGGASLSLESFIEIVEKN
jgi:triosephosphate isomerase